MVAGPEIVTGIFSGNKELFIALGIIGVAVLIIKWYQYVQDRLDRIK
jgi:hypothetical protein